MNHARKKSSRRLLAVLLTVVTVLGLFPTAAFAAQESDYHDPADQWITTNNRTSEMDANSILTHETFPCVKCGTKRSFMVWRTPEYTRDGHTALERNIKFSDGTMLDGVSTGTILDGTPGVNAYYTGYHWMKSMCETCGTINANQKPDYYAYTKNVYILIDCAAAFFHDLPETVTYAYADSTYHTKTVASGEYCSFCFGTYKTTTSTLERHHTELSVDPQLGHQRFVVEDSCALCDYEQIDYVAAKSVIADYYGVVDGKPHTISVTDLSEAGVTTKIRYGNSAGSCTLASAPTYIEEGQYTVYYEITYTYKNTSMTENGVAYVWLRDEAPSNDGGDCSCGCGDSNCTGNCAGDNCGDAGCGNSGCGNSANCGDTHNFILLDSVDPTCLTLGYDRYLCVDCGKIEKRDYTAALGHAYQGVVIREATCETDGKLMEICSRCGAVKVTATPKGEHKYKTYSVAATCTNPGYTVQECSVCGDRHIIDITSVLPHNYQAHVIAPTCETGGKTIHQCGGCGSSFVTDYTDPLDHNWDDGTIITHSTCTGEGVTEYRCVRCGYHRLEGNDATDHTPGAPATCTQPQICTKCGVVIVPALGHSYTAEVTDPTCSEMGFTTHTCTRCGDTYKDEYTNATGHKPGDWIVDEEPTVNSEGKRHRECENCGKVMESEHIDRLKEQDITDSHGEATVGGYLVIVTDTDTEKPVMGTVVSLKKDNTLAIRLPDGRLLDYANQTTVTVLVKADRSAVPGVEIAVTDRNDNYSAATTDKTGQITVPGTSGKTNDDGKATVGWEDEDGNRYTLTVKVEDHESGRPIKDAGVSIGKTGRITVTLPDGVDMDENNRITVTVTDHKKIPQEGLTVIVKSDLGRTESGETDKNGKLTVPAVIEQERHGAYIYGYPDGTFGPERGITRSEAAAIFARLLAERNGDTITPVIRTGFDDIPANAWYSGYVKYLMRYGVTYGTGDGKFSPDRPITRAEFTVMAVRFFEAYGDGNAEIMERYTGFSDISDSYWAAEYIRDAALYGWIKGYGDGTFRADAEITRAEVVTLMNRMLGREADEAYIDANIGRLTTFTDMNRRHWAYYAVIEAANTHTATLGNSETWSK